jgi:hypothetical protein
MALPNMNGPLKSIYSPPKVQQFFRDFGEIGCTIETSDLSTPSIRIPFGREPL